MPTIGEHYDLFLWGCVLAASGPCVYACLYFYYALRMTILPSVVVSSNICTMTILYKTALFSWVWQHASHFAAFPIPCMVCSVCGEPTTILPAIRKYGPSLLIPTLEKTDSGGRMMICGKKVEGRKFPDSPSDSPNGLCFFYYSESPPVCVLPFMCVGSFFPGALL